MDNCILTISFIPLRTYIHIFVCQHCVEALCSLRNKNSQVGRPISRILMYKQVSYSTLLSMRFPETSQLHSTCADSTQQDINSSFRRIYVSFVHAYLCASKPSQKYIDPADYLAMCYFSDCSSTIFGSKISYIFPDSLFPERVPYLLHRVFLIHL